MQRKIDLELVVFEVTESCNQSCKFCYNHWKGDDNTSVVAVADFKQAQKTLKTLLKQATVGNISLSGGEPMLMPQIHDLILKARFKGVCVNLLTNGTKLTDDDLEILSDLRVSRIQIPILSHDAGVHNSITQRPGSWQSCTESAKKILKISPDLLTAVMILSGLNIHHFEKTLSYYNELGVRSILLNRFNIGGLGRKYAHELNISHQQIRDAFAIANNFSKETGILIFSGVCTPICILDPKLYPYIRFSFCNLDIRHRPITINYKGDVRFCNHSPKILGNIHNENIHSILNQAQQSLYFSSVPAYCSSCKSWEKCKGGCRAASEQTLGTFEVEDPVLHAR